MRVRGVVRALASLPAGERAAVARVAGLVVFLETLGRMVSLRRLVRLLGFRLAIDAGAGTAPASAGEAAPSPFDPREARDLRAVERFFRRWRPGRSCLRRALVLGRVLRARDPLLRIGVARGPNGEVHAHAWIELDGREFPPSSDLACDFRPLERADAWLSRLEGPA